MGEETFEELEKLLKCSFHKDYFHYVENGIKLPCDGYACEKCIEPNKELKCQFCTKHHFFNEKSVNDLKPDRLCQATLSINRKMLFDGMKNKLIALKGTFEIFFFFIH